MTINGKDYLVRISNKTTGEHCGDEDTSYSQTACGFVVEFVDCIGLMKMRYNDTNAGGYPDTNIYAYLKNTLFEQLPLELQNAIIPTRIISGHGYHTGENNFTTNDNLYLLSAIEIYGEDTGGNNFYDTAVGTSHQLQYYTDNGVTYSTGSWSGTNLDKAIKHYNSLNNNMWLRAAISNNTFKFAIVTTDGVWHYAGTSSTCGFSPAFRIG